MFSFLYLTAQAKSQSITLRLKKQSLEQAIAEIKKTTNLDFFYVKNHLRDTHPVSLSVTAASITELLDQLLKGQPLTYEIKEGIVVLKRKGAGTKTITSMAQQQQTQAEGTILSNEGAPLAGASISVKGTSRGTSSDNEGRFSIQAVQGNILVVNLMGYETREIVFQGESALKIQLAAASSSLDEVVVIGYGSVRKRNLTGAVSSINNDDLNTSVAANFQQMLQGKAAGLEVTQPTGQPGAGVNVKIRSNPSFANAGVLYVIDGVPVNDNAGQPELGSGGVGGRYGGAGVSKSPMNFINPNDIESIEVLKDASAASIYGARAGAGVVLITTKKGRDGQSTLQYSGNYGIQQADKMYPVFGVREYMEQRNLLRLEMWHRDNEIGPWYGTKNENEITDPYTPAFTDDEMNNMPSDRQLATDAIVRGGYTQQHNISLSGGGNKTTYFISGNYFDQKGVIIGTDYKRYNGRMNLDHQLSEKIKLGSNVIVSNSLANNTVTGGTLENGGIVTSAIYWAPVVPLQAEDGSYPLNPFYPNIPNPLSYTTNTDLTNAKRVLTSAYGEWTIIDGLKAKASFSYDQSYQKRSSYFSTDFLYGSQVGGAANISQADHQTKLYEYIINYDKEFNEKHTFGAMLGYSFQQTVWNTFGAGHQNFLSDALQYYDLGAGQADRPFVASGKSESIWASYFGRVIYTYNNNITLQASLRRDGASVFAENRKWGMFPGLSAGWIISDESWMSTLEPISFLKLRTGYGETGNSDFQSAASALYNASNTFFGNGIVKTGLELSRAANPNLTWETAGEFNVGLDFGLFNQRVSGSVDYYNKTIRNLISWIPYPSGFLIGGVYGNAGKTRSTGYEINLETRNFVTSEPDGFSWNTTFNFSHYLNYWLERSPEMLRTLERHEIATGRDALFNPLFGYLSDGIFTGRYGEAPAHMSGMLPGGIILRDIHGYTDGNLTEPDGQITEADKTYIGNADPQFNFGIGNTLNYKGFDLNIFLSGMKLKKWSPIASGRVEELTTDRYGFNAMPVSRDRWHINNTYGQMPTALYDENYSSFQNGADYWLLNATFLRARNITLGYTLSQQMMRKQKLFSNLRLSFDMQNLFTITKYPGLGPELDAGNFYPLVKSFVFGINANF